MRLHNPCPAFSLILGAFALMSIAPIISVEGQTVIYRENFGATTNPAQASTVGWSGVVAANGSITSLNGVFLGNVNGAPQNLDNVNAGTSVSNVTGVAYSNPLANGSGFVYTQEFTLNRSVNEISQFSFYEGNGNITNTMQVAVYIGGTWYVSNTAFTNSVAVNGGGEFATKAEKKTLAFSTDAANWSVLNFTSQVGTSLGIGAPLTNPLPGGNITAFGIYFTENAAAGIRLDTFEVQAVPEPQSMLLMFGGLAMLAVVARRARHSLSLNAKE